VQATKTNMRKQKYSSIRS